MIKLYKYCKMSSQSNEFESEYAIKQSIFNFHLIPDELKTKEMYEICNQNENVLLY